MSSVASASHRKDRAPGIHLAANGKLLSNAPNRLGYLAPTNPAIGASETRAIFEAQGHVLLKGLLKRADVIEFRGWVFSHLAEAGLLQSGSDPRAGIAASEGADRRQADRRLMSIVRSAAYEGFCAQPALSGFMDEFLSGLSYLHKRKIMRFTLPNTSAVTPAHYDLVYLRGGTSRIVTAWIPIGDIPVDMGGLCYLENSHAIGTAMEAEFNRQNAELTPQERISAFNRNMTEGGWVSKDLPEMADRFNTRWLVADYEAGDVVLHSPYMIHASTTNQSAEGRIRLSTDIRYQNIDDEIDARWGNHWTLDDML